MYRGAVRATVYERYPRTRLERTARGLWIHVQPIFLLPGAAMSVFGALLASDVAVSTAVVHAVAVCLVVYVAHLEDGYVDYYVRSEDKTNPLDPTEIRVAIGAATGLFACCLLGLWLTSGALTAALTGPLLVLGYVHAPQLDTNPVTATVDYPLGIVLATMGGYAAQTRTVSAAVVAVCLVLFFLFAAINVLLDRLDYQADRRVAKRTLPVVLGPTRAQRVAQGLAFSSVCVLVASSLAGPLPHGAVLAGVVPAGVTLSCFVRTSDPKRLVTLYIGATYFFAVALFLAIRFGG